MSALPLTVNKNRGGSVGLRATEHNMFDVIQPPAQLYKPQEPYYEKFKKRFASPLKVLSSVILVLLDLSAAFDTIDHNIIVSRPGQTVGIRGMALEWFKSFLSNRPFSDNFAQHYSKTTPLFSGVPQGSILDPILLLPLGFNISMKYLFIVMQMTNPFFLSETKSKD